MVLSVNAAHRQTKVHIQNVDSGGIIAYVRNCFVTDDTLVRTIDDSHMWLKFKGVHFGFEHDLYMCLAYVIPENSGRQAFMETHTFNIISDYISHIQQTIDNECNVMLVGDLNSRCGSLADYVVDDSAAHIPNLPDDYINDDVMPRSSQDSGINENGRFLIDLCKETGLRIANGRVCEDANTGKFTFVDCRGSSMVDLVVVKSDILKCFSSFTVDDPNVLSDHCNISFSLLSHSNVHVNQQPQRVNDDENQSGNIPYKYKWNSEYTEEYTFNMQSEEIVAQLDNLIDNLKNTPTVDNVNQAVSGLSDIFDSVCSPLFKQLCIRLKIVKLRQKIK